MKKTLAEVQLSDAAAAGCAEPLDEHLNAEKASCDEEAIIKYSIYVGLNHPVTHRQMFSTEEYTDVLKEVCRIYQVPFSFNVIQGGYIHDDGTYTEENSLHISIYGQTEETVNDIAEDLCTFFNQESVMVVRSQARMYYIKADRAVFDAVNSVPGAPASWD